MKILIDVNLPASWIPLLADHGHDAICWTEVGDPTAPDSEIMQWARENDHIVFTHDLDFGALLALSRQTGPSVLQIRTQNIVPDAVGSLIVTVLEQKQSDLMSGALISIDEASSRIRILPIK